MKTLVKVLLVVMVSFLSVQGSYASGLKSAGKMKKVSTEQVTKKTKALGLETYEGRTIDINSVKKRFFKKKTVAEILNRAQIELKSGEIVYPEEVQFALVPKNGRYPKELVKAPHTPH